MRRSILGLILCGLTYFFLCIPTAFAAQNLDINVNQSYYLSAGAKITRVAVANPEVADVKIISGAELLVIAKKPGSTSLTLWTSNWMRQEFLVNVSPNEDGIAENIQKAIGLAGVQVQKVDSKILLRGIVTNQYEHDIAMKVAGLYGEKDSVVDLLEMSNPSQIRLEAQIIEISSDDADKIGLKYAGATGITKDSSSGFSTVTVGEAGSFYGGEDFAGTHDTGSWILNHISRIDANIQLLVSRGKARILSRPSITTLSGEKANILIGGRIPVPVSNDNGKVSVDWRDYGIKLNIAPRVDRDDNVTASLHAEVSTLDYTHAVRTKDFEIPAISSREAESVVNVPSGMTMAIGGLLNSEESKTVTKVPLLGDIPIIGEFFRHTSTIKDKRELIILITPRIVNETTNARMSDKMKEAYEQGKKDAQALQSVDLNAKDEKKTETAQTAQTVTDPKPQLVETKPVAKQ